MGGLGGDSAADVAEVLIGTRIDPTGVPIVTISGELDSSNVASLEEAIAPTAERHPELLIFDLSLLRFMDSAGIAVLVGVAAKVNTVRLRNPSEVVRRVIQITGLSSVLHIES
jgi:anti-sigma B factor antagonist